MCLRSGFEEIDIHEVMLTALAAPEAGGLAGFVVTLSCLNE